MVEQTYYSWKRNWSWNWNWNWSWSWNWSWNWSWRSWRSQTSWGSFIVFKDMWLCHCLKEDVVAYTEGTSLKGFTKCEPNEAPDALLISL